MHLLSSKPDCQISTSTGNSIYSFLGSSPDSYRETYDLIATDHVEALDREQVNPFVLDHSYVDAVSRWTNDCIKRCTSSFEHSSTFVEVGVGEGLTCLPSHAESVTAVDIAIAYLRRLPPPINLVHASAENLPFLDSSFQCAVYSDIFEHVVDLHAVIRESFRIISPMGFLVVRVPHDESMTVYRKYSQYKFTHLRSFGHDELENLLARVYDFEVVETLYGPAIPSRFSLGAVGRPVPNLESASANGLIPSISDIYKSLSVPDKNLLDTLLLSYDEKLSFLNRIWLAIGHSDAVGRDRLFSLLSGPVEKIIIARKPA